MKLNSTLVLTLILLSLMLGAGFVSAMWGVAVGQAALKGVTQPDVRPTNKLAGNKRISTGKEGLAILPEKDILAKVKAQMNTKTKASKDNKKKPAAKTNTQSTREKNPSEKSMLEARAVNSPMEFPLKSQNQGVTLQLRSARQQGGSLLLNVSMKNESPSAVRFLYSFLNVTDDSGHAVSAVTEGLPGELPPNGEEFSGIVSIPTAMLENAKKLSLKLTDYPNQKLQLQMSEIPVAR